jgi:hypothetical protein
MRLLIYLLALLCGFSAANPVRAEATPASTVAQTAVAAADALIVQEQQGAVCAVHHALQRTTHGAHIEAFVRCVADTPVARYDISIQ